MSKQTVSNEYVSAFCLEMSLLLHAGIGIEDGLYLLIKVNRFPKQFGRLVRFRSTSAI